MRRWRMRLSLNMRRQSDADQHYWLSRRAYGEPMAFVYGNSLRLSVRLSINVR